MNACAFPSLDLPFLYVCRKPKLGIVTVTTRLPVTLLQYFVHSRVLSMEGGSCVCFKMHICSGAVVLLAGACDSASRNHSLSAVPIFFVDASPRGGLSVNSQSNCDA